MKNLKKLNRKELRTVLGGHTCVPFYPHHVVWNGTHACCSVVPAGGNPCPYIHNCLVSVDTCESGGPF